MWREPGSTREREPGFDDVLAWIEALILTGTAVHGALVVAAGRGPGAAAYAGYTVGLVAAVSATRSRRPSWVAMRATVFLLLPWIGATAAGGTSSPVTAWYAVGVAIYSASLPPTWGKSYPPAVAVSFLAMAAIPGSALGLVAVAGRSLLLAGGGYAVWGLAGLARRLSGERTVAEAEMRRAQTRFRAAFAGATSGMAMTGFDGRIIQANQSLGDVVRVPAEDLAAANWLDFVEEEHRELVVALLEDLDQGEIWSFRERVRLRRGDGTAAWVLLGVTQVAGEDGHPINLFINVQDISSWVAVEERLRRNEEHYRNLFGRSPIAMWELDFGSVAGWLQRLRAQGIGDLSAHLWNWPHLLREGAELIRVVAVNDAAVELLQADGPNELERGLADEMLTDEMLDALAAQFVAIWNGEVRVRATVKLRSLRGRGIEAIAHFATPVVGERADLSRVALALTDITEYRRTQDALTRIENRLRAVVGAAPIVLFALDQYGVFTLSEGQGLVALDLRPGEAVGRSAFEMFRNDPQMIRAVRRALSGEAFTTMVEIGDLVFDTRFNPMWADGRISGVIGVAYDITERTRATERLEQLIRSKDEFVASVSHELRTPLTAVVGFSHELRQSLDEFTAAEVGAMVDLIADQSTDVADLVEDLLVAARVDIDKVAIAPRVVSMREHVDSVLAARRASGAQARTVEVVGGDVGAFADPIRVRQILRNLVSNADRYGGRSIEIRLSNGAELASVEVRDDGPGVPEEDRTRIFEPYFRAHRVATQPSSVGLGLTVSRQLARMMGGDLTYHHDGEGTVFALTLPAAN
jgi:PAS domain S-box-containing protein